MALVTEDGSGLANAESYISAGYVDSYLDLRGNTLWVTLTETQKEAALRRATDYIEQVYGPRFAGYPMTSTQALSWPRDLAPRPMAITSTSCYWPNNAVPSPLQKATAELAFKAAAGELAADVGQQIKREKVGPIETEYMDGSSSVVRYRVVENLIAPLLKGSSNGFNIQLVRA